MNERGISFNKIWFDEDMVELRIQVSDGSSSFVNEVYVGHQYLKDTTTQLDEFKTCVYGGIYDFVFGRFGPEYAHGAFHARLHFQDRGILHMTVRSQSDFRDFGKKNVASEATLYLKTEPALLDNFIREMKELTEGRRNDVTLETI